MTATTARNSGRSVGYQVHTRTWITGSHQNRPERIYSTTSKTLSNYRFESSSASAWNKLAASAPCYQNKSPSKWTVLKLFSSLFTSFFLNKCFTSWAPYTPIWSEVDQTSEISLSDSLNQFNYTFNPRDVLIGIGIGKEDRTDRKKHISVFLHDKEKLSWQMKKICQHDSGFKL